MWIEPRTHVITGESGQVGTHYKPTGCWWKGCARPEAHVRKDLFRLSLNVDACTPLLVCAGSGASETERDTQRDRERQRGRDTHRERERQRESLKKPNFASVAPAKVRSIFLWYFELNVSAPRFFTPWMDTTCGICRDVLFFSPPGDALMFNFCLRSLSAVRQRPKRAAKGLQTYFHLLVFCPRSCRVSTCNVWLHHRRTRKGGGGSCAQNVI